MTSLAAQLGELLTEARGERSRRDLADAYGVSNTTLLAIEHGKANPTLERVERLAEAYGVTIRFVVEPAVAPAR